MSLAAAAAVQLSPRSHSRAQSQLARANTVTGQKGIGSTPIAQAATIFLVHSLLERRELYKLLFLVRRQRITVPMLDDALACASKRSDVLRHMTTHVDNTTSTIAHELARSGTRAHLEWVCNNMPELLYAREPLTEMNFLHVCAVAREDNDSSEVVRLLWCNADPKLLAQLDSAGYTPVHYLAMCNRREASAAAVARAGARLPASRAGETVDQLLIVNLERTVAVLETENRRHAFNIQAAEGTSLMLTKMHEALDQGLNERDAELARLRAQLALAAEECDKLRDAQAELAARGTQSDSAIVALQSDVTAANEKAQRAHTAFHEALENMRVSQATARTLADERERLRDELKEAEQQLRIAQQASVPDTKALELAVAEAQAQASAAAETLASHQDAQLYLETEYSEAKSELESLRHDLARTQENYTAAQCESYALREEMRVLQTALQERGEQLQQLRSERDVMRATRAEKSARRGAATTTDGGDSSDTERQSLAQMQKQLDEREQQIALLQNRLSDSLREPVAAAAIVLPPPPPPLPTAPNGASRDLDAIVRRNHRLNSEFYNKLMAAISRGDAAKVRAYLELGVSANTRNFVGDGQTLLQIAVLSARETHSAVALMNAKDHKALMTRLEETIRVIIETGGDWDALDEFLDRHSGAERMPPRIEKLLRARDDIAPFCKALIEKRDEEAALAALDGVEDLMRVPSKYAAERHTYLHLAAAFGFARLIERMVLDGLRIDANRRDAADRAPLHLALQACAPAKRRVVVEALLAAGASPTLPCKNEDLTNETRRRLKKRGLIPAHTAASSSADSVRYGMPLAQAESLGDAELVECMRNRRHLRVSIEPSDEKEFGAPLLQDYVIMCVSLHVQVRQLLDAAVIGPESSVHRLFLRYGNVFHCFNPHFGGFAGYGGSVLDQLYRDAGAADDRHGAPFSAVAKLVDNDQVVLATLRMPPAGGATLSAADNLVRSVCTLLFRCTEAIRMRWFEVATMIEQPARDLYDRAAAVALRHFVLENRVAEIDFMLNRTDGLFGALDVNSVVDAKRRYTPIELATWRGCADTLEYFLERQRQRIDAADASKGTLVQIARDARRSISIVLIDYFKYRAHLSRERHPNAPHYDMTTADEGNTVVAECARQHRIDLLRFCVDRVAFQLEKPNNNGETPLRIIDTMLKVQQVSELASQQWRECNDLIRRRIAGEHSDEERVPSASVSVAATPRLAAEEQWRTIDLRAVQRLTEGSESSTAEATPRSHRHRRRRHKKDEEEET